MMVRPNPAVARKVAGSNLLTLLAITMLLHFSSFVGWVIQARKDVAAVCCEEAVFSNQPNTANALTAKKRRGDEKRRGHGNCTTAPSARGAGDAAPTRQRGPDPATRP